MGGYCMREDCCKQLLQLRLAVNKFVGQAQLNQIFNEAGKNEKDLESTSLDVNEEFIVMSTIGIRKCTCSDKGCDKYWLTGIGSFVQGSGFEIEDARLIVDILKKQPRFQQKMKAIYE
jgi:hypothetical protein